MKKTNSVDQLVPYGFEKVGFWYRTENEKVPLGFEISAENLEKTELIYAFTSADSVRYIGVAGNNLKERMNGYKYGKSTENLRNKKVEASTNKKLHKYIMDVLGQNHEVDIYILCVSNLGYYKGLKISPVNGIEHSLIKSFDNGNLLNDRGTKVNKKATVGSKKNDSNGQVFKMPLGKEYYLKGKIGFKKPSDSFLPSETRVEVEILDAESIRICQGVFTRSGKTLYVNGKQELKDWFKKNFNQGDEVTVTIINPKKIVLSKES
jgi:hypothetical protein